MKNINFKPDKNSDTPLYIQLYSYFKENITSGEIANDERLPSRRALEKEAKLSKSTIELAYQKLMDDGYAAVSYTHLDVYKRQRIARLALYVLADTLFCGHVIVINAVDVFQSEA